MPHQPYGDSAGVRLLHGFERKGVDFFSADDAVAAGLEIGLERGHVLVLLHHLAAAGRLVRLKKGVYAVVDAATDAARAHPYALGAALVTPSAVSHWSALQHWGLTEQIPSTITLSTPTRTISHAEAASATRRPTWTIQGVAYEFVGIRQERFFGVEHVWLSERDRVPIFHRERALLDGFHHFHVFGAFAGVFGMLEEHFHDLDLDRLVFCAVQIHIGAVAKRVGWALERLGAAPERLDPLRTVITDSDIPLDPGLVRRGRHHSTWHVIENLGQSEARRCAT